MSMPTLFELSAEYRAAADKLADLDMPADVIADTLEGMSGDLTTKAQNVAKFIRNLEATADQIDAAIAQMQARRDAYRKRADQVHQYLFDGMTHAGISKIECPWFVLSVKKNPPRAEIRDESSIPADYWRQPETPPKQLDKRAILASLKSGVSVPGADLIQTTRLEIK